MIPVRSESPTIEMSWFCDLCNGDYRQLGVRDPELRSSFSHCRDIVLAAEKNGYQNILLPSSYQVGQDVMNFASAVAPMTKKINLLTALRMGEYHPPMLARAISTLDHILEGRLTINIISSDLPGLQEDSLRRYQRSREIIKILRQAWSQEEIDFRGEFYNLKMKTLPVKPYQQNGGPLLYFGGTSDPARELCAEFCDVFLMWPETISMVESTFSDLSTRAAKYGRKIDMGYRVHVIVRESESKAREAARHLVSKLDEKRAAELKFRSQDAKSLGVIRQDELRTKADSDGYIEEFLWSGIGQARSGCGSAIVGDPDQVYGKLMKYVELGVRSFVLSGYPLIEEADLFAKYVLPRFKLGQLNILQNRKLKNQPETPLTYGPRE